MLLKICLTLLKTYFFIELEPELVKNGPAPQHHGYGNIDTHVYLAEERTEISSLVMTCVPAFTATVGRVATSGSDFFRCMADPPSACNNIQR